MNIAFVNGKGGVGKSTLCYLIALGLIEAGKTVSIEDLDPQQSLTSWLDPERDGLVDDGECRLIDTRPAIDDATVHDAITRADRILLPCSPSPGDITAARASVEVVRRFISDDAKAYVVLNMVKPNTNLSKDAPEVLEMLGLPVVRAIVPDKQCIQRSVLQGWKALDPPTQTTVLKLALEVLA
jgi:chromosome partitioning protein